MGEGRADDVYDEVGDDEEDVMKEDGIKAAGAGCSFPICLTCTFASLAPSAALLKL